MAPTPPPPPSPLFQAQPPNFGNQKKKNLLYYPWPNNYDSNNVKQNTIDGAKRASYLAGAKWTF